MSSSTSVARGVRSSGETGPPHQRCRQCLLPFARIDLSTISDQARYGLINTSGEVKQMKRRIIAAVVGTAAAVALAVNGLGNVNGLNLHRDVNGLAQHTSVTVKQSRVNGL